MNHLEREMLALLKRAASVLAVNREDSDDPYWGSVEHKIDELIARVEEKKS